MTSVTLSALRQIVKSGGHTYPLFIGFLPAEEIAEIAGAPSFARDTSNSDIATDVLAPSHKAWQRPIDTDRTTQIAQLFAGNGEFMPNAVLLSENIFTTSAIQIRPISVGGVPAPSVEIEIPIPVAPAPKPLWILDGQHRINGLARSAQSSDPVPLVLLLNQGHSYFGGSTLAKIFAQVTTEAKPLGPLHNEWLTYAFNLQKYSPARSDSAEYQSAMNAVGLLCTWPQFQSSTGVPKPNPFFGRILFNDYLPAVAPAPGGFAYNCAELTALFRAHYFSQPTATGGGHLSSADFATQFLLAHDALVQSVMAPQDQSVFFGAGGSTGHGQKIMQDAFVAGISQYLLQNGMPASWATILQALKFHQTAWNFRSWVVSLSGSTQSDSNKVARTVFADAFREGAVPLGTNNLGDYLRGDRAKITFSAYEVSPTGALRKKTGITMDVDGGSVKTMSIAPRTLLKISAKSTNVARITVTDMDAPPGRLVDYTRQLRKGLDVSSLQTNPLRLLVTFHYYGGVERTAEVSVAH